MVAALLRGESARVVLGAFALGAVLFSATFVSSRRGRSPEAETRDAGPPPADAYYESLWEVARSVVWPSTVGLTVLTGVALAFNAGLAALLAGILFGAGVAALALGLQLAAWEKAEGVRVFVDGRRRVFVNSDRARGGARR